ncbi:hypothetical protein [Sphingomonas turrisvirgatae]|uniref:Uncharacterized protein n=1 Tax=Sphingomonas turrisvirgatae TaxID=1888892 RepID=A0A1E3LW42_9SPHN|nr:hypothetical protein [Sphingomonas turrisvirgatae]ODP37365.1 hypothetical protein BFL28_18345 [Sphingomonas turrisvirgatae]
MGVEAVAITPRARQRRAIADHFCAQHAVTPYDTVLYRPPPALRPAFDALLAERLIRQEGDAYFWLDLPAWDAAVERRRRKMVPVAIIVSVVLALVVMLGFYQG